jgi:oleate hydratase
MTQDARSSIRAHLIGGGLASLAAAAYLIKHGGVLGENIRIYETGPRLGGALGVAGGPETGYIYPGSRVFESHYRCAMDLFSHVPSASDASKSIKQEIVEFNKLHPWNNRTRLVGHDAKADASSNLGLTFRHTIQLAKLILTPESLLGGKLIKDCVTPDFFETNFWFLWSSIMAFLPGHSAMEMRRYILRFMHLLPDLFEMTLILRTKYNQYQAIIEPLSNWLARQGVRSVTGTFVSAIEFDPIPGRISATALQLMKDGTITRVEINSQDVVMVTNGSQVSGLSVGSMSSAPRPRADETHNSWALWKSLARGRPDFGHPEVFTDHVDQSRWVSFTVTCKDPLLPSLLEKFSGRKAGRGGLMTFKRSNWLLTIVSFHQPNFIGQPENVFVWWGYGIYPGKTGNYVQKQMVDCSGAEILREVLMHLGFAGHAETIIKTSICISCLLPYVSSVCLARNRTDRPPVVPKGSTNFAFIGQFCEQPDDVIFTMEYSVRSAWTAVHKLLKTRQKPPPIYKGYLRPSVMLQVLKAMRA